MSLEGLGGHSPEIRASDAEREYVVDILRAHCSEGRIDLDEFSERINRVYAARTIGELNDICADLPVPATPSEVAVATAEGRARKAIKWTIGIMSGPVRKGRWRIEGETNALAIMGGVNLDLRDAEIAGDEIVIHATAIMGGVDIIVPEGVEVHISGIPFMGGCDDKTNQDAPILPGTPIIRVKYFAMMGGVTIKSKASPAEEKRRREERKRSRDARRAAMRGTHDVRSDARREVHEAIQQAKLEAIQQAREATKRALAAIPEWLGEQAADATPAPPSRPTVSSTPPPPSSPSGSTNPAPEGTVTLLVTDIEGSTSMTEEMGDIRWMRVLNKHNEHVRKCVLDHGGIELKFQGDGFLLAFPSARKALLCAVSLQKTFHEDDLPVRMGLHTGEVIRDGDDLYGRNVILATRISDQARGGEILVSSLTKELTDSSGDLSFNDDREVALKGLNGTFRVWSLDWK